MYQKFRRAVADKLCLIVMFGKLLMGAVVSSDCFPGRYFLNECWRTASVLSHVPVVASLSRLSRAPNRSYLRLKCMSD